MALIIVAHPNFEQSIANKIIIEKLQQSELMVEIRYLKQLYSDYCIDIHAEQEALQRHRTIVFQYPFYWYNMPGLMKHWFDEVFTSGFAYGRNGDKLKGKNFVASFTVGAGKDDYSEQGIGHYPVAEFCHNLERIAAYVQMNYINPVYCYGVTLAEEYGYTKQMIEDNAIEHGLRLVKLLTKLE